MKKLLKRWVPLFMALALVVGAVNNNYLTVRATGSDTQIGGGTAEGNEADAVLPEDAAGQSEDASVEAESTVPESEEDVSGNNAGASADGTDVSGNDAGSSLLVSMGEVAMMALSAAGEPAAQAANDKSYKGNQLTYAYYQDGADHTANGDKWDLTFTKKYGQVKFQLPEEIDLSECEAITFAVSQQTCPLNFQIIDTDGYGNEITDLTKYGNTGNTTYRFEISGRTETAGYIMIQSNADGDNSCTFDGITFEMKGGDSSSNITPVGDSNDKSYKRDQLSYNWEQNAGHTENGDKWDLTFSAKYGQVKLALPEEIDLSECEAITFAVSQQTGALNFQIIDTTGYGNEITGLTKYGNSGKTLYRFEISDRTETAGYVMIQSNEESGGSCTLDGILFEMKGGDSSSNITPVGDSNDKSYKRDQLSYNWEQNAGHTENGDKWDLTFSAKYGQVKLALPEEIDLSECEAITFAVSQQTGALNFQIIDTTGYGNEITDLTKYGNSGKTLYRFEISDRTETAGYVMIQSNEESGGSCTLDGILFEMKGGDAPSETPTTRYYTFKDVTKAESYDCTPTVDDNGTLSVSYTKQNGEVKFAFPEGVDGKTITKMVFHVTEGDVSNQLSPRVYADGYSWNNVVIHKYCTDTIDFTTATDAEKQKLTAGSTFYFGLDNNFDGAQNFTVDYFSITAVQTGGLENPPSFGDTPDTTENVTPAAKGAEDHSWKAGDMVKSSDTTSGPVEDTEQKRWKLTFAGAWQQADFDLPVSVDLSLCNSITFAVSEQTAALSFKIFAGDEELSDYTKYHQNGKTLYTYETKGMTGVITKVAVMLHSDDKINATETCTFDGVMFDMKAPEEIVETYEVTYQASQLTLAEVSGEGATSEFREDRHCITFPALNNGARYTLPESISLVDCESITIRIGSQTGPVNFYTCVDGTELESFYYNIGKDSYTIVPSKGSAMNSLKVLCGGEEYTPGSCIEIISVTFLMKGVRLESPVVNGNTTTCSAGCFDFEGAAKGIDGVTVNAERTADGKVAAEIVTFERANLDLTIEIPATVDVKYLKSIALDFQTEQYVSGQARALLGGRFAAAAAGILRVAAAGGTPGVTVSLLNADKNVIASADSSNIISLSKYFTGAKYIRFTSTGPTKMTLTGIAFNVKPPIVLNGNFEDDDVSMWTGGWSPIEAVSGDSAIVGGVSTYGKVTNRTSPYQGFIQDITARVTSGKIYKFSFWAKLSDAYKDADASLREVTFAPYYKDENGKEQYGLVPGGTYKQSLTAGEWTYFEGTVTVPENATSFVIRIMEQGTNYGKGDCLKGEYYVTGVKMWETDKEDPGAGNGGGGGGGYDPNFRVPTKESNYQIAYEAGNLEVSWASATTATVGNSTQINFKNNYDEARFKLPRPLDMSLCAFLQVKTSNQNVPIAIKLYKNGVEVQADYYNRIDSTYVFVPKFEGNIDAVGIMSLATPNPEGATVTVDVLTFGFTEELPPYVPPSGIVWNGDFADEDLSDWYAAYWDNVTIKQETSKTPIYDDVRTYGTYSRRTSPYQCFAQDITDRVEQGETYTFSFWAKLSNDYKDAPPEQRVVQFAPYTEDKSGKADYNPRLEGTYSQTLEPGVWTYFEGTYKVTNENPISRVVIRILEQGTNYGQGDCVKGSYSVTGVKMAVYVPEPPSIDEDVPNLRDVTAEDFGSDFLMGTAMSIDEVDDIGIEMLVKKHFSAVTLGNELKPDALFGYSNGEHTPLQTIDFNGQSLEVPTLNYTRAEELLDKILEWNEAQPDKPIKVRGHVLVWHAQTPEWFFREGYTVKQNADGTENYVTPEVMNLRLEWYIKTVLEHFTGKDSPYKDLFYGWDVVNEAVSDSGVYRTDKVNVKEQPGDSTHSNNSSWWAVYHNNEFIVNAFKYANKYAPADLELYYNDYNDSEPNKVKGIALLLSDVLAEEGTRIDAMGMQCHYTLGHPTLTNMEKAIRTYAEIVGKVQLTEFDLKAAGNIGTEEGLEKEYHDQAVRYHEIYEMLKKLDAEDGIEIGGFIVWGTIDSHSWLQTSSSVGGGADGTMSQCPLLFDANYKVKPAFWAFADYTKVDPEWKEAEAEEVPEETEPVEEPETPEEPSTEEELKAASVAAASPKKGSPIPIIIAVCVAVAAVGGGSAYAFLRKKKDGAGTGSKK